MARRRGLEGVLGMAAQAKEKTETGGDYLTTAIHIPRDTHRLLRAVAFKRAQAAGGRASVSAIITQLVEDHREELTREAGALLD